MSAECTSFPIWKTIKLGSYKTLKALKKTIRDKDLQIFDWADDTFYKPAFTISPTEIELDLACTSAAGLGFKKGACLKDIYLRAIEYGLELCPGEVGPQLRLDYIDQPNGEWLLIATESITDSDDFFLIFDLVCHDGDTWLNLSRHGHPDGFWDACRQFIFVLPRK